MKARNAATEAVDPPPASGIPEIASYYRWDEPDTNLTVLLKPETVDRMQTAALAEIDPRAHSGDEIGGVLLGRTEPANGRTLIVVEEFEPVFCEHRKGSSYSLEGEDRTIFEAAIAWGKARRGCRPVGYCRSHVRPGLFLSSDDVALIHRHFPNPDHVFLLIKPLPNGACTAGFFFWKNGRIRAEFTGSEVPLIPVAVASNAREKERPAAAPTGGIQSPPAVAARRSSPGLRQLAAYGCAGVALVATAAILTHRPSRPAAGSVAPKAPAVAERALPKAPSQPVAAAESIPPRTPQPQIQAAAARPEPPSKPAADNISTTGKPFVLPSRSAKPGPAEPAPVSEPPLGTEPPLTAAAPIMPALPIAEAVAEPLAAPQARPAAPAAIHSPAPLHTLTAPRVIHRVTPAVPRGVGPQITSEVQVDVEVKIDAKGKVTDARVRSTRGAAAELLTIEALKAAQLFRFQPAEENGRAVPAVTTLTFRFAAAGK